jgi:hypothetical protein
VRRHEFQPAKLIAGVALLGTGVSYLLDAAGEVDVPAFLVLPVVVAGLCLSGLAAVISAHRSGRSPRE